MTLVARPLTAAEQHDWAAARLHAVHALLPYLAHAVFRLEPWAVDGLGTFAVDARWRVLVDPALFDEWGIPAVAGVVLHEVGHALRDHAGQAERAGGELDAWAWNLCGDAAINDDLVACGVPLPGRPVLPSDLHDASGRPLREGGTAGSYYEQLPVVAADAATADVTGDTDPTPRAPGTVTVDASAGAGPTRRPGRAAAPSASCGEVAGGDHPDVELPPGASGVGAAEQRLARRAVAADVVRAARGARSTVPAGLRRWAADELAPPRIAWQQQLRGAVRRGVARAAGAHDTTYARPSRRRVPGVVLPGTRRPVPTVAAVVDTSASMDAELLAAALAEVEGIARQVGAAGERLAVLTVDAAVHTTRAVTRAAQVELRGGGGTDLTPGLEAAAALRPAPDVVVVLTDGFTPWPDSAPSRRIAWVVVLLGEEAEAAWPRPAPPAWATTIVLDARGAAA